MSKDRRHSFNIGELRKQMLSFLLHRGRSGGNGNGETDERNIDPSATSDILRQLRLLDDEGWTTRGQFSVRLDDIPPITRALVDHLADEVAMAYQFVRSLKAQAAIDPLTRINSRRTFNQELANLLYRRGVAQRRGAPGTYTPVTIIFFDLNNFKQINDKFGHSVGDDALQYVAKTLNHTTPPGDIVARFDGSLTATLNQPAITDASQELPPFTERPTISRFGGDEFAVILYNTTAQQARDYVAAVRKEMQKTPFTQSGQVTPVELAAGIREITPADLKSLTPVNDIAITLQQQREVIDIDDLMKQLVSDASTAMKRDKARMKRSMLTVAPPPPVADGRISLAPMDTKPPGQEPPGRQ